MNLLAQIPDPSAWLAPLAGTGIIGLVLKWFMGKNDANFKELNRRLLGVENSNNRQTRALSALLLAIDHSSAAKREADLISSEINESEKHHTDKEDDS